MESLKRDSSGDSSLPSDSVAAKRMDADAGTSSSDDQNRFLCGYKNIILVLFIYYYTLILFILILY